MTGVPDATRHALRLMVITDPRPSGGRSVEAVVEEVLAVGVRAIQLRDKQASARELLGEARRLRQLTARHGALLIVNDRLDVALAAGADGVHLGPGDVPVAAARRVVPDGFLLGHSTDDPRLARQAEADGRTIWGAAPSSPPAARRTRARSSASAVSPRSRARSRFRSSPSAASPPHVHDCCAAAG